MVWIIVMLSCVFVPIEVTQATNFCPSPPCLFYTDTTTIRSFELSNPGPSLPTVTVASNLRRSAAITTDVRRKLLFWSDISRDVIQSLNLTSGHVQDIVTKGIANVRGMAVDWETGLVYWTDYGRREVSVVTYDGTKRRTLVTAGVVNPHGIAVDPRNGLMFWTDLGSRSRIQRATLSGHNQTTIVDLSPLSQRWPHGITIDYTNTRLYWLDSMQDQIMSVDYNGRNRVLHRSFYDIHAFSLDLLGDLLYWSDTVRLSTRIRTINKLHGGNVGVYYNVGYSSVMGIVIYDLSRQPRGNISCVKERHRCQYLCLLSPNGPKCACPDGQILNQDGTTCKDPCAQNNGNCSHRCLVVQNALQCACPYGMTLKDDGKTCYYKEFLLYADAGGSRRRGIYQLALDDTTTTPRKLPLSDIQRPTALDFDPLDEFLYWTDVNLERIMRAHLNGSSQTNVITSGLRRPQGLAVDAIGRNLYWTDMDGNVIEVSKLNGSSRKVLVSSLDEPKAIVLDLKRGYMYWSSWGQLAKIERADMNGANRTLIRSFPNPDHWTSAFPPSPNGLALDPDTNQLYWIDEYLGTLKYLDLKTHPYRVQDLITSHLYLWNPFGLAVNEEKVFWSEQGPGGGIFSVPKTRGNPVKRVASTSAAPRDVHVYHNATAFPDSHPCTLYNGWCTHLCLVVPGGYRCACPTVTEPGPPCSTVPNRPNVTSTPSTTTTATPTTTAATTTTTTRGTTTQTTTERKTTTTQPTTTEEHTTTTRTSTSSSPSSTTTKYMTTTAPTTEPIPTTTPTTKEHTTTPTTEPSTTITPTTKEHTTSRQTEPSKPSTKATPTTAQNPCYPNPCINEGKCTKTQANADGFVCRCKDGFASKRCDVFYGEDKVEITLEMKPEDWKTAEFKEGIAKMVNGYCENHDCQAKYRRRRRASGVQQFTPDDVIVIGDPKAVSNGIKVQTVVLEPRQENQAGPRKPMSGSLLCAILRDIKESGSSILKGYNILSLNGQEKPTCPGAPIASKNKGQSSGDSDSSSSSLAAVGAVVGVSCVLVLVIILFFCYRKRRLRRQKEENETRPNVTFSNPGFQDEPVADDPLSPTYEEIGPDLRDEILGLNNSLPWQEDFAGLSNPTYHGVGRRAQAARAQPETQLEENRLKDELRVNMKLEGDSTNTQNSGNHGNGASGGNLGNSVSDSNDERYVPMPVRGMLNRNREANGEEPEQNFREEPEYASIPVGRSKEPGHPSIPSGRSRPKVDRMEPEYSSIPSGRSKERVNTKEPGYPSIPSGRSRPKVDREEPEYSSIPSGRDYTNQHSSKTELNTESADSYEKMNSDKIVRRPPLGPPPEDPTLNGTYDAPGSLGNDEDKRTYANVNDITGLPLEEDPNDKHTYVNAEDVVKKLNGKSSLEEKGLDIQGDKIHKGQEKTENKGPKKGPSKKAHEVVGTNGYDETVS